MRPNILTFNRYYVPGYRAGGPIRSVENMVERLADDFEFSIVTSDRDVADVDPYPHVAPDGWNTVGHAQVWYASPSNRSFMQLVRIMRCTKHDVVYLNSFLDPRFTLKTLLARRLRLVPKRPVVLAPRGEFSAGAWQLKRWKKRVYLRVVQALHLYDDVTWQASSQLEVDDILRIFGGRKSASLRQKVVIAPNLAAATVVKALPTVAHARQAADPLRMCFLSRISPKKNLHYALAVLAKVPASVQIVFHMYGPIESKSYWDKCREVISSLPTNVSALHLGSVEPANVMSTLATYDLFFLPTLGENYGHVIHEALLAGLPVLISDKTPWCTLEEKKIGWSIPLSDSERFLGAINKVAAWTPQQRVECGRRARQYALQRAEDPGAPILNRRMFNDVVESTRRVPSGKAA